MLLKEKSVLELQLEEANKRLCIYSYIMKYSGIKFEINTIRTTNTNQIT